MFFKNWARNSSASISNARDFRKNALSMDKDQFSGFGNCGIREVHICIRPQAQRPPPPPPNGVPPLHHPHFPTPESIQVCMSCYGQPGISRRTENIRSWPRQRTDSHGNRFRGLRRQSKHIIRMHIASRLESTSSHMQQCVFIFSSYLLLEIQITGTSCFCV